MINKALLFLLLFATCMAAEEVSPLIDRNFSPLSGAANILWLQRGMEKIEDSLFLPQQSIGLEGLKDFSLPPCSLEEGLNRQLRNFLFWIPASLSLSVTQHEIFGHGYRIRDLGSKYATVEGYKMYMVAGATSFNVTSNLTASQMLSIGIAGLEADAILGCRIRMQWMRTGHLDPRLASLYSISSKTLIGYSLSIDETATSMPTDGNDIAGYLFFLNMLYPDGHVSYRSLRNFSLINLLDPFFIFSWGSGFSYEKSGTATSIPTIKIGEVQYLPALRGVLTPFGLQGIWENFFLKGGSPACAYLKWGKNGPNVYWGFGIESPQVFKWSIATLGFRFDFWHQPHVLFKKGAISIEEIMELTGKSHVPLYSKEVLNEKQFGVLASVIGTIGKESWAAWPYYELGYKTAGYLPGEALRQAPIIRLGLSGTF